MKNKGIISNQASQLPPGELLEVHTILNALPAHIKKDCSYFDPQTGSCDLWGSLCCKTCRSYEEK